MSTPHHPPIQIHIPPTLLPLAIPLATLKASNPTFTSFATGTFIFTPSPTKLLLIQRASSERGFPSKWEVPGGSTEDTDPTILHSAARETFEETGLRLTRFVRQIGEGVVFTTGGGDRWLKLSFEIEVAEVGGDGDEVVGVEVRLDPAEHQAFSWVSEEDVKGGRYAITTGEQQALMLKAFELHRSERVALKNLVDGPAGGGEVVA